MTNPLIIQAALIYENGNIPGIDRLGMRGFDMRGIVNSLAVLDQLIGYEMENLPPHVARLNPLHRQAETPFFNRLRDAVAAAQRANFGEDIEAVAWGWFCPQHDTRIPGYLVTMTADGVSAACPTESHVVRPEARILPATEEPDETTLPFDVGQQVIVHRLRPENQGALDFALNQRGTIINMHAVPIGGSPADQEIRLNIVGSRYWFHADELRHAPPIIGYMVDARVRLLRDINDEYDLDELPSGITGTITRDGGTSYSPQDWRVNFDGWGEYTLPQTELEIIR